MLSWQSLQYYLPFDRRVFETADRRVPDPGHLAAYRALAPGGWRTSRRGLWFIADPPAAERAAQGWKLHVTAVPEESAEVLRAALPGGWGGPGARAAPGVSSWTPASTWSSPAPSTCGT
ncbi:hypothetical protein, partial [Kitasatospora sp. NPDC059571]|uniref:class III lanthionine synthetase LanKC N-terminal domain-containing protein n=1 Tax=Kitasatospora sp. NPDC059571 TaxID=3346871 RepID=UPI003690A49E